MTKMSKMSIGRGSWPMSYDAPFVLTCPLHVIIIISISIFPPPSFVAFVTILWKATFRFLPLCDATEF